MANKETNAFCTQCGAGISSSARFCRACGAAQEPPVTAAAPDTAATLVQPATAVEPVTSPLPPLPSLSSPPLLPPVVAPPQPYAQRTGASGASILAVFGGLGMLLMALCAIVYYPLHYHYSVNYGESVRFGDILVFGSAAVVLAVGIWTLRRPVVGSKLPGVALLAAGALTLALTLLWVFPEIFHPTFYPPQFYSGFTYITELGQAHIGDGYLQVPLAVSSSAVILAGFLMLARPTKSSQHQH